MSKCETVTDHDEIRKWAETRGGRPAVAEATQGKLFFERFRHRNLAPLEQEQTRGGGQSRFFDVVAR